MITPERIGWTVYAIVVIAILIAAWRKDIELSERKALLDEMRQREHDRPKPPRRYVSRPGNKGYSDTGS
jgi:hypothetical protein